MIETGSRQAREQLVEMRGPVDHPCREMDDHRVSPVPQPPRHIDGVIVAMPR